MSLTFDVIQARVEPYATVPTLTFRLKITETTGREVHGMALRCQVQIEPRRRAYTADEKEGLVDLFGEPPRWADTLKSVLWTEVSVMVPGFTGSTEANVPVVCTYDFEVAATKYFHVVGTHRSQTQGDDSASTSRDIPLLFLFSGTAFLADDGSYSVSPVPQEEATMRLPLSLWEDMMDRYFPSSAWIRLRRETFDVLHRYKSRQSLTTWDETFMALLEQATVKGPSV